MTELKLLDPLVGARTAALLIAFAAAVAAGVGWFFSPDAFYRAYLHGWLLWLDVSLGSMGLTLVIHLLGGAWGASIRRLAEAAAMVLPLMAVLFVPIAVGVIGGHLYPWAHGSDWQSDPVAVLRRPYLNVTFFLVRAVVYGVCWIGSAVVLWRGSHRVGGHQQLVAISGPLLVLYVLTMGLFASTDWILSLEPDYKSTVFGLIIVAGQGVSGLSVGIGALCLLSRSMLPKDTLRADDWNDLGSVLLTVTMLWCYLVVCQFVINWMGNTQGEVGWYLQRMSHGWRALSWTIVGLHLVFPLVLLLFRRVKRSPDALLLVCGVLLVTRAIDGFWMVNASGVEPTPLLGARFSWLDVALPIGIGAVWVAGFVWVLGRGPLMIERPLPTGAAHVA